MLESTSELEQILCNPLPIGSIEQLVPRVRDAWAVQFPDLRALPSFEAEPRRLRICIATEDIVGPVRNGGIGTTYAALAELLAKLGHESTILYLKGMEVETGDIPQWVDYYAQKGVKFVPVPNYAARDNFRTGADRWLSAPYNMLRYLLENPMDVVHVSEWRGSGYLSLLAKHQGLAFSDTLFITKTSSPWMWNRLYGSQPVDRLDDLAKIQAERKSVELADMVIGGSLHLLRWMSSQGYQIPRDRTFVQPNVAVFDHLKELMNKRSLKPGSRVPVEEIVFFGRLEARKGLLTFCQAIKRLIRMGAPLPPQLSFMGKPGAKLGARPDQEIVDFIEEETRNWPVQVQILTEFQQYEALEYLLDGNRLAVMPSTIENSSMAVYEAAICGIPFVSANSGGTPELVAESDRPFVLCDPHPLPLADKIAEQIKDGAYVAGPSFDNDANLETWRSFHRNLGSGLLDHLLADRRRSHTDDGEQAAVSACIYYTGRDELLEKTLESLAQQELKPSAVLIAVDADESAASERAQEVAGRFDLNCEVVDCYDLDAGSSFNALARKAESEFLQFLWEGSVLAPQGLRALSKVARSSSADVLNYFYRVHDTNDEASEQLKAVIIGSTAEAFFREELTFTPLFVRRSAFDALGGFTSDYRTLCFEHEFISKAILAGRNCQTALMELGAVPAWDRAWLREKCYDTTVSQFRAIRPQIGAVPLGLRDLLLTSKGLQAKPKRGPAKPKKIEEGAKADDGGDDPIMASLHLLLGKIGPAAKRPAKAPTLEEPPPPAKPSPKPPPPRKDATGLLRLIDPAQTEPKPRRERPLAPAAERPMVRTAPPKSSAYSPGVALRRASGLAGELLAVKDGKIYGWASRAEDLSEVLNIEVEHNGRVIHSAKADATFPFAAATPDFIKGHCFVIELDARSNWLHLGGDPTATVRVAGSKLVLSKSAAASWPAHPDLHKSGFDGYCDPSDNGLAQGWAWRPSDPGGAVEVALFIDGKFLARVPADKHRDDLLEHGIGNGGHGFAMPVHRSVRNPKGSSIEALIADHGIPLNFSPLIVTGTVVRPSSAEQPPSRVLSLIR